MADLNFLKHVWDNAIASYCSDTGVSDHQFDEIILPAHSEKGRHYHNLNHLEHLLRSIDAERNADHDYHTLVFTTFYHDIVYYPLKKDNEQKSAKVAAINLAELNVPSDIIEKVTAIINATANHMLISEKESTTMQLFLDADLGILGADRARYVQYIDEIRQEYRIIPAILYNPGRRKILEGFLKEAHLFRTASFRKQYEEKARANIQFEIDSLS